MNRYDLAGEVAIVTGGAQGIGLSCAKRFLEPGASVAFWDVDEAALDAASSELGEAVID